MPNKLIDIVGVSKSYGDNLVLDDPVSYTHLTLPTN